MLRRFLAFLLTFILSFAPLSGVLKSGPAGAGEIKPAGEQKSKSEVLEAYQKLPLYFIENQGQVNEEVLYYARLPQGTVYFTGEKAVFQVVEKVSGTGVLGEEALPPDKESAPSLKAKATREVCFSLNFAGANKNIMVKALGLNEGKVNYLTGNDPAGWHTNIPTYQEIVYQDLWPGIDLYFKGEAGNLKYELVVKPGACPETIRLAYEGIEGLELEAGGGLLVKTAAGVLKEVKPYIYQEIAGEKVAVEGSFTLTKAEKTAYGFAVVSYDPRYSLVIDPLVYSTVTDSLVYSTYLGGSDEDCGNGIAIDGSGHAYVTGETSSTDFPTTSGAFDGSYNGSSDVFVTKLNADGSALVYSTYLGGSDEDCGNGIAIDGSGHAYVTGETSSTDFPTTSGAVDESYNGSGDAFVTKLYFDGSALLYSTYLGGSSDDSGKGIALDNWDHAYVTGYTESDNFPTTSGAVDRSYNGSGDAFVIKLNFDGSTLVYSTYLGGSDNDSGFRSGSGIAIDGSSNAYVTGYTESDNFPTTSGAVDESYNGCDAFVTKLNFDGSTLVYSTYLGGSDRDCGNGIAIDGSSNAYVTGYTESDNFPTTSGAVDESYNGSGDAFVTKLNSDGSTLVYSTYLGGDDYDIGRGIAIDGLDRVCVTGRIESDNFPTTRGAFDRSYRSYNGDAFVTKLNSDGSTLVYSTYLGGSGNDSGQGIALDGSGYAYVTGYTGYTESDKFPTTGGAFYRSCKGSDDAFVTRLYTEEILRLATIKLSGAPSTCFKVGDTFDLKKPTLKWYDQYGKPYDLTNKPVYPKPVKWASSNTGVAVIVNENILKAVGAGKTKVTATVEEVTSNPLEFRVCATHQRRNIYQKVQKKSWQKS